MNNKTKFVFLLTTSLLMVFGTIPFSAKLFSLGNTNLAVVLILVMIVFVGILSIFIRKCYYDLKAGIPSDDERIKKTWLAPSLSESGRLSCTYASRKLSFLTGTVSLYFLTSTKKVRMYAAGYAYFISLYVWILLLAFHRYLDSDDLLMIGLLGMVISFYLSWVLLNRKKDIT